MRNRKITLPTLDATLAALDAEEDRILAKINKVMAEIRQNCRPEFADRMEKYLIENDLLQRPQKQN